MGTRLEAFYSKVAKLYDTKGGATEEERRPTSGRDVMRYLKAATKATNDKYARVDRAEIIERILETTLPQLRQASSETNPKTRQAQLNRGLLLLQFLNHRLAESRVQVDGNGVHAKLQGNLNSRAASRKGVQDGA